MERARWRLGRVRADLWLQIPEVDLIDNPRTRPGSTRPESDLRVRTGAGLRVYLPVGRGGFLLGHALPEYLAWRENSERSAWGGRAGIGFLGFYNRLEIEAQAGRVDEQEIVSAELGDRLLQRSTETKVRIGGRLTNNLTLLLETQGRRIRLPDLPSEQAGGLQFLDRDEGLASVGLRYDPLERLSLYLGREVARVDFLRGGCACNEEGGATRLGFVYRGADLIAQLNLAYRTVEPEAEVPGYTGLTGEARLWVRPQSRLRSLVYATRVLVGAVSPQFAHYEDERVGVLAELRPGWRTSPRLFVETGSQRYFGAGPGLPGRRDRLLAWGGSVEYRIGWATRFRVRIAQNHYQSDDASVDRTSTVVSWGFSLEGAGFLGP